MESNSKKTFWDSKPYWCQPWSIIGFGMLCIILSVITLHNTIITIILSFFIVVWWVVFLILVPNSYQAISDKQDS